METLWQDMRYGARMLWKNKGFTAVTVTALALGIGFNTAIFSVVDTVLLRPLPYTEPDRLVSVWERNLRVGMARSEMAPANYLDLRAQNQVFDQVGAFLDQSVTLTGKGEPERLEGQSVSANVLSLLGVQPTLGRTFLAHEDQPGQHRVVVLSYGLWQRRFDRDAGIVGQQITLDGQPFTVAGVMPPGFFFPQRDSELWIPLAMEREQASGRGDHYLRVVGRLKRDVSAERAKVEVDSIAARLAAEYPRTNEGLGVFLNSLHEDYVGDTRTALLILFGAVGLVLLIACANVANLLLARSTTRQREVAIRTALGARRWRIARQLLTESLMLACLGGFAGLLIAIWGVEFLLGLAPQTLLQVQGVSVDGRVLMFTLLVTVVTGTVFGLVPALQASRIQPGESLKDGSRGASGGARSRHLRSALVVSEVALALVLLVGAGLLLRSFQQLSDVDPGFNTENVLTMRTVLPGTKYQRPEQRRAFYDEVLRRVEGLPGVESAGMISFLPLSFSGMNFAFTVEGSRPVTDMNLPLAIYRVVSPDYFRTMRIPTLRGRAFDPQDTAEKPAVVVVNRKLAEQYWPGQDAVGKRVKVGPADSPNPWATVIGVVGDVRQVGLQGEQRLEMYASYKQDPRGFIAPRDLVVRTKIEPASIVAAVREQVWAVDKDQPVSNIRTMEQVFASAVARERFQTLLLGLFAALALVLAVVGLYGVMSYAVTQRTHEIGIRMALGAQRKEVLRLIIGQGMVLTLVGVALGLGVALAVTRLMAGILYGVTATDPTTFVAVASLLAAVAFIACYIPARRATKVDPLVALRYE
jgi:putative ABC transport system permease protein